MTTTRQHDDRTQLRRHVKIWRLASGNAVCCLLRADGTFRDCFMLWKDRRMNDLCVRNDQYFRGTP